MSKQFTKPKQKRDEAWFKDMVLLVQAQANGQVLHEEEIEFFADLGIAEAQSTYFPVQQDDIIISVVAQLKTQVVNCTKINQDNKNVNEILTAELERYKDQVRILKEENNVDKASDSCEQSVVPNTWIYYLSFAKSSAVATQQPSSGILLHLQWKSVLAVGSSQLAVGIP
nr:hypothetical protein [Tanacetum cinerariifolium]